MGLGVRARGVGLALALHEVGENRAERYGAEAAQRVAWRSVGDGGARWKTAEASGVGAPSCTGDGRERAEGGFCGEMGRPGPRRGER